MGFTAMLDSRHVRAGLEVLAMKSSMLMTMLSGELITLNMTTATTQVSQLLIGTTQWLWLSKILAETFSIQFATGEMRTLLCGVIPSQILGELLKTSKSITLKKTNGNRSRVTS